MSTRLVLTQVTRRRNIASTHIPEHRRNMSLAQAKSFLVRLDEDEQVRSAAHAAYTDQLLKLAVKLGYEVTGADLAEAIAELSDVGLEMSLEQLESVAGGVAGRTNKPFFEKDSVTAIRRRSSM